MQQQKDPKGPPDTGFSKDVLLGKQEQSEPAEQEPDGPETADAEEHEDTDDDD